jgi:Flp pilus assembly pilin Flp
LEILDRTGKEPLMLIAISRIRYFLESEAGPTAVEYAVMTVFLIVAIFAVVASISSELSGTFSSVSSTLS